MSYHSRISKAFEHALCLPLYPDSRYVLFSDCHRGCGTTNDNYLKNEFLWLAAVKHYDHQGFTYLELGDGDELWENRSIEKIKESHLQTFQLLSRLYQERHFYAICGNHDMIKKYPAYRRKHLSTYFCEQDLCDHPLFPDITFYSGIILKDIQNQKDIYLTHGHQSDILNSTLWRVSRFLVRFVWTPLEKLGIPDPTSAAKNNSRKKESEKRLASWAKEYGHILIAGHTHHPMTGSCDSPYFNTGSCVHPSGITAIEIEHRCITLVKWSIRTRPDMTLYASREILGETLCIDECLT